MKTCNWFLIRSVGFLLLGAMMLLCASSVIAAQSLLEDIRKQPAITSGYSFTSPPPSSGKGIAVAIVSQGFARSLQDVVGDRLSAYSVLSDSTSPYDEGEFGIGNGMVSIVAALAPEAKIINVKTMDSTGSGSYESIRDGIRKATELGARIIVLPVSADEPDSGVTSAVNAALQKGILIAAAAGNNGGGVIGFPANVDGVLSIGASTSELKVTAFSSVDTKNIYAPGQEIKCVGEPGKLESKSGTSHASAVAGGIFAVLWSQAPSLSREQLVEAVRKNTKQISDGKGGTGKLIDGAATLRAISDAKAAAAQK